MSIEVKSIRVHEYGKFQVDVWHLDSQTLADDEVAVKVIGAAINPIDVELINGKVKWHPQLPFTPGIEGYGQIIMVGKAVDKKLVDRKVIISSLKGLYTTYNVYNRKEVYVLDDNVNLEFVNHSFYYNPITAADLLKTAMADAKPTTIIYTGASSNVGKWLTIFANKSKVNTVAIIRNGKHLENLKALGADIILTSSDPNFKSGLHDVIEKLKPNVILDALGGNFAVDILGQMPDNSTLWSYGTLEGEHIDGINLQVFNRNKTIRGYFVCTDLIDKEKHENIEKMFNQIYKGEKVAKEEIQEFNFDQFASVLEHWGEKQKKFVLKL